MMQTDFNESLLTPPTSVIPVPLIDLTEREQLLKSLTAKMKQSPSHSDDHLLNVTRNALWLAKLHGGNRDVLVAAALLHDVTRIDPTLKGTEAAKKAARVVGPLLDFSRYSEEEKEKITQCIAEHDDPKFHSQLLESKILKDADFLDSFGARGVLRSLIYAGETGGGVNEGLERLQHKMRKRLDGLEFAESKRLGWQLYRMTELFLSELFQAPDFERYEYPGKLIVLEGISGSGKDTQLELLKQELTKHDQSVLVVNHPTKLMKELWTTWKQTVKEPMSDAFLMMADRVRMMNQEILPALKAGKIVISSRSSWSAQAYQAEDDTVRAFYRFCFTFEPIADALIYLQLSPEQAHQRAESRRAAGTETTTGLFGSLQTQQAAGFEATKDLYPNLITVDAAADPDTVSQQILEVLRTQGIVV